MSNTKTYQKILEATNSLVNESKLYAVGADAFLLGALNSFVYEEYQQDFSPLLASILAKKAVKILETLEPTPDFNTVITEIENSVSLKRPLTDTEINFEPILQNALFQEIRSASRVLDIRKFYNKKGRQPAYNKGLCDKFRGVLNLVSPDVKVGYRSDVLESGLFHIAYILIGFSQVGKLESKTFTEPRICLSIGVDYIYNLKLNLGVGTKFVWEHLINIHKEGYEILTEYRLKDWSLL